MHLLRRLAADLARRGPGEVAAALAAVAGAIAAAVSWWRAPSFWIDELFVALNLRDRGPLELLGPLDFRQMVPMGFLLSEKLVASVGGDAERALRFLPAIAALGAILLLPRLLRRFGGALGVAAGSWLVVSSAALYRHGIQAKPYAFDLAAAVVVPLLFSLAVERGGRLRGCAFGAAAAFAFFSFASWIVTVGTLAGLVLRRDGRRFLAGDRRGRLFVALLAAAGGVAFALARLQARAETGDFLRFFWRQSLFGAGSDLGGFVAWSIAWLQRLTGEYLGVRGGAAFVVLMAGAAGWLVALRRRGSSASAPLAIFALAFTLSATALYPVTRRLAVFLLPMAATGLAGLLQPLDDWAGASRRRELLGALLITIAGMLRMSSVVPGAAIERPREMMSALAVAVEPGDTVYVRYSAVPAWAYYAPRLGLPGQRIDIELGECARERPEAYRAELAPLCGRRRVWAVFSHSSSVSEHESAVARLLGAMGHERARVAAVSGSRGRLNDVAVLYDFGDQRTCERGRALALLESLPRKDPRSCRQFDRAGAPRR
jgi:hypothetical protein